MNWAGNVGGFLEAFRKGLGGLLGKEGTNLDGQEYINGQDPNYLKLKWDVRKKYDEQFPKKYDEQSSKKDLYDNYVMQGNPFLLDLAGTGKRMNEVGLNPWVSSVGLPGEPGRPGVPSAPKDGRPLLPGEKPYPKIFAALPFLDNFLTAQNQGPSSPIKYYPDANSGSGGFLFNSGAGRIGDVRMKA